MKNNIWLLFKTNFINTYKFNTMDKKKKIGYLILVVYILFIFISGIGTFLNGLFKMVNEVGLVSYYIPLLFTVASFASFALTIFSAKNGLFENKDNDLLFSLPIKRSEILASRLIYINIYNLMLGFIFIIPGLYIYLSNCSANLIYIVSIVISILFFSIVPTILACIFGYLVASLTSHSRHKNIFELIYYVLFILIYVAIMNFAGDAFNYLINNIDVLNIIMKSLFLPIYLINKALITGNFMYVLFNILFNLVVFILFIYLFNKKYLVIISRLSKFKTKNDFTMKRLNVNSARKALVLKEFKRYFSSAIYVFNTLFGVIFLVIAAVLSLFYSYDSVIKMANMTNEISAYMIIFIGLIFVIIMSNTANSSISMEKNSFWILKMIPVRVQDIFFAKKFVNMILVIPASLFSLILFTISGYINSLECLMLIPIVIIYAAFVANFGLICNLLFPKFDAVNDASIVKQSVSSLVSIMTGFAILILVIALGSVIKSSGYMTLSIGCVGLVLYLITCIVLNKWGINRFNKL